MSDLMRNALADKVKKYDEAKKLLAGRPDPSADCQLRDKVAARTFAYVQEYVLIMTRDGHVDPYLGIKFADEMLSLVLGREARGRLHDLNLSDLVRVVHEIPAKEDDK